MDRGAVAEPQIPIIPDPGKSWWGGAPRTEGRSVIPKMVGSPALPSDRWGRSRNATRRRSRHVVDAADVLRVRGDSAQTVASMDQEQHADATKDAHAGAVAPGALHTAACAFQQGMIAHMAGNHMHDGGVASSNQLLIRFAQKMTSHGIRDRVDARLAA